MGRIWAWFLIALAIWAQPGLAGLSLTGQLDGKPVVVEFTDAEIAELGPWLRYSIEPTPAQVSRLFSRLTPSTREKLATVRGAELRGAFSGELSAYAQAQNISLTDIEAIRQALLESIVAETIDYLEENPQAIVRFVARDMNEFHHHFVATVQNDGSRTTAQRLELLRRAKAVTLSRPVAAATPDAEALWANLAVSKAEVAKASEVLLLDLGYDGTLAQRTRALVGTGPEGKKLAWRFAWKSLNAPAEVTTFPLETFNRFIAEKFPKLAEAGALHRIPDGFRVRVIEHAAKWNERSGAYVGVPVYLMLDVDDTVLKEVDRAKYGTHANVQSVTYVPSAEDLQRYRERLKAGGGNGKILHYEINGDRLHSYVVVRPAMVSLLEELKPLIDRGEVVLLVTSANDVNRTQAVSQQIVVGDRTLEQWGGKVVSPANFGISGGQKSAAKLREDLALPPAVPIVAIDDLGHKVVDMLPQDNSVSIEPWDEGHSTRFLDGAPEAERFALEDETALTNLALLIRNKRFVRASSDWERRLRVLAGLAVSQPTLTALESPTVTPPRQVSSPNLWEITPKAAEGLAPRWAEWRRGTIEAAAYARVFFRGEDFYATGRDSLIPLYALMLASKHDPEFRDRLHYLDLSTISQSSALLLDYLAQEGISRETLAAGQKVRLYDIGYSGTTPNCIRKAFGNEFDPQIQHYYMAGNPDYQVENPYSLMFNIALNPNAVAENGRHYVTEIQEVELQIPKVHNRTIDYVSDPATQRILPVRSEDPNDFNTGLISVEAHQVYMADFAAWVETPEVKQLLAERHEMWTVLKKLADGRRDAELVTELQKIARNAAHDPFAEGIVYEMAAYSLTPIRVQGAGPTLTVTLAPEGCADVLMNHPPRRR